MICFTRYAVLLVLLASSFSLVAQSKKAVKLYDKARTSLTAEDPVGALDLLDKALEDSPEYVDALLLKAEI